MPSRSPNPTRSTAPTPPIPSISLSTALTRIQPWRRDARNQGSGAPSLGQQISMQATNQQDWKMRQLQLGFFKIGRWRIGAGSTMGVRDIRNMLAYRDDNDGGVMCILYLLWLKREVRWQVRTSSALVVVVAQRRGLLSPRTSKGCVNNCI